MISFRRIASYVGAEPFRPFRVTMASGQTYDIRHPEMIAVNRSNALIYTFFSDDPELARQRQVEVSLLLMESVEPLTAPAQSES